MTYSDAFGWQLYGHPARDWILAAIVFVIVAAALIVARQFILRRFAARADGTTTELDDFAVEMVRRTRFFFVAFISLDAAALAFETDEHVPQSIRVLTVLALLLQIAIWGNGLITLWARRYVGRKMSSHPGSVTAVTALGFFIRAFLWAIILLLALENLGVNITALVAGLGVGGIAVALAVQNILGDLLGALSIVMTKPFVVGDTIQMNEIPESIGTVRYVGLRSTRVQSLGGEEIIIPNKQLLESRIRNHTRLLERRAVFGFGVAHETPPDKVEAIPTIVRDIVSAQKDVRFDRAHFVSYGETALRFEAVYYVTNRDYKLYLDRQQAINLALLRRFRDEEIELDVARLRKLRVQVDSDSGEGD